MDTIRKIIQADKGLKGTEKLSDLQYDINDEDVQFLSTNCIPINLIFGGRPDGGIAIGGMSMISADSQLGKSIIGMNVVRNAQKRGMHTVVIDTERAFRKKVAQKMGVNTDEDKLSVFQTSSIETVETIIMKLMNDVPFLDRANILILIDSWGPLVTSKTIDNALVGNDKADFSDAKKKNRLANICLNTGATFMVVNHVYDNVGGFGDPLKIPGGKKIAFNCDNIGLCTSRARDKGTEGVTGHIVSIKTYKSRFSIAETKMQYRIRNEGGLDPFFGMLPDALEHGCVEKPKPGKYIRPHIEGDKEIKEQDLYTGDFWGPIYRDTDFSEWLENKYQFSDDVLLADELNDIF